MKREMENADDLESRASATLAVGEYIDGFYNLQRRRSAIGYNSPMEFGLLNLATKRAAKRNCPPNRVNYTSPLPENGGTS